MNEENNNNPPKKGFQLTPEYLKDLRSGNTPSNNPFGLKASATDLKGFTGENMDYLTGYEDYTNYKGVDYTDPYHSIEGLKGENQSASNKLVKGAGRVITKTLTEVAKIPGYAGGILAAIGADEGEGWNAAFNNDYLRGINQFQETINNEYLDVHHADGYQNLGFLDKVATADFWATEGADGLGYMLSAFAPGALVKATGLGGRLLGGLTEAASLGNTATKGSMLSNLAKIGITANSVDNGLITIANTYFEAGAEAGNAMENFELGKSKYISDHIDRGLEDLNDRYYKKLINAEEFNIQSRLLQEEAEEAFKAQKGRLGRDIFLANAAILLGPNAIQTKLLFGGGASKFINNAVKPKNAKTFLTGLAGGVFAEGFFEEGMQSTVENMFSTSAKKGQLTSNPLNDFNLGEVISGYTEMLSSTEGQSAVFLGALMGGVMNGVGNMKNAKNDYALTQKIVSNLGSLTSDTMNNVMSIYKKDTNGNIIVDEKGNPSHNIQDSANFVLRHLGAEMLNNIYENAKDYNNESVAKFVKNTYAYDLGRSFINYGKAGYEALNEYLNAEIEAIQNNSKIDKPTKDIMLKEAEDTAKVAKKAYRTATANNEAYNLIESQITPDLDAKFKGPNASDQKLKFLTGQRNAFLRNRMFTDLVNDTLEDKYKTLEKTEAILKPKRKAPSFKEIFNPDFTTVKEETETTFSPLLESLKNDIANLEELENSLHEDYVNKLSSRDYLMKEMESFSKKLTNENIKNVKQAEFEPVANSIANASTLEQLNDIKLDPSLDIFKDDFEAAKAKRKAEIDNLTNELKKQTKAANQDQGDPNPIVTDTPGIVESTETAEAQASQVDEVVIQEPTNLSEKQMAENAYYSDKDGYVFSPEEAELLSVTEDPSLGTKPSAVELDNQQIAEELEAENVSNEVPAEDTNLKTDTQNIDDKGLTTENDGVEADLVTTNIATNDNQSVDLNVDNRVNTNGSVNQEVPDDPENNEGVETIDNENSKTFNVYADSIKNDSKVTLEFNGAEGISQKFELRFPRLIIPRKPLVKLLNYINNFKNKAGDVFNVKVNNINNNYQPVQSALRAFEKLKRIQNNSGESLTTQEYEDLLYRLPLNASLSKDNQIIMAIDGIAGDNHAIQDGKIKMTEGSYGFINAFPIRLQIINALLKDINAPINVTFAKQFAGFLNINRDENGISIQNPLTELKALQDIKDPQERIKYLQDALAYVDLERDVRGLANPDSIITTNASTPGIIYLRLPNRAGTMKNVQLSRRKIEDTASPADPISKSYNLAFIIQQSVNLGVNPYEMSLVDFLNTIHEEDSARIYSQFSVPIQILNEHFRGIENISMHSFLNFFTHTSDNLKTKFNFQDGYVQVGKLINKTAIDVTSFVKESNDGLLYISGQDLMNKPEAMDSLRNYFQLLKHNVDKTYAYNPLYIEYLMNEVLTVDIKPGEDAFVTNVNTKVRKDGQVLDYKNNLEPNIYINHIVDTPTVDRTLQLSDEILDRMDPKLRSIVDHVGLEEIVPDNSIEQQKADIERRRQEELLGETFTKTTEKVITSKGQSNGKTIIRKTKSKISSDGEVLTITPTAEFKEGGGVTTTPETMTLKEFKEQFYEKMSEEDKEFFDEIFEGVEGTERIKLKEARIGLKGVYKGQVNIDVETLEGQPFGFRLNNDKEINAKYDAELEALENNNSKQEAVETINNEISVLESKPETIHNTEDTVIVPVTENYNQQNNSEQQWQAEQKYTNKGITKDTIIDSGVLYMDSLHGSGLYYSNESMIKGFKNVDFRMLYDDTRPSEAEVLKRLDEEITNFGEDNNVKYIARKLGDMWVILQEGNTSNLLSIHFQVTERGANRRGGHSAVILKLPKDVVVNQEGLNSILPMINQFRDNNYETIDGRLRPKNKENNTNLDLNLISSNVSQQKVNTESITPGEQIQLDLFNDETISATTEDALVEQFMEALNNLSEQQIQELNEEIQQDASLSEYERTGANEISSTTESSENISTTSEGFKSFEQSESDLDIAQKEYQNLDHEGKVELIIELSEDVELTQEMWNMLDTEQGSDALFQQLIDDAVKANQVTKLKNKICNR